MQKQGKYQIASNQILSLLNQKSNFTFSDNRQITLILAFSLIYRLQAIANGALTA